jgi:Flp pilus assembly protein TadG
VEHYVSNNRHPGHVARRRGFAIILTALMLCVVIPMVGLAIDVGIMYSIRARIQSACDAAALSAARTLNTGITVADQSTAATARAQVFFDANFPLGTLSSSNVSRSVQITESDSKTRTVTVTGSASAPVFFMSYFGVTATTVGATGAASRRDVNVMLVMDRSTSLANAGACDDLETAAISFSNLFANERDKMGLLTYGGSYRVDYPPSKYFKSAPKLVTELEKLYPDGCHGATGTAQAIWNGYKELVNLNEPGAMNVLVLFTDGQPNTVTAELPVRAVNTASDYPVTSRCYDWANSKAYNQSGWNPVNQKYLGWIAAASSVEGVKRHQAPAMPVSENGDRTAVTMPVGYTGTPVSASSDCYWRTWWWYSPYDVAYYPDNDYYGNSMFGYKTVSTYPSGHTYAGHIRMDNYSQMGNAAVNAADNAAQRVRDKELNGSISVIIHVVGLGGVGAAEGEFLRRVANTKDSPVYDSSKPEGLYLYAPGASQLGSAFARIASEILRISQ